MTDFLYHYEDEGATIVLEAQNERARQALSPFVLREDGTAGFDVGIYAPFTDQGLFRSGKVGGKGPFSFAEIASAEQQQRA